MMLKLFGAKRPAQVDPITEELNTDVDLGEHKLTLRADGEWIVQGYESNGATARGGELEQGSAVVDMDAHRRYKAELDQLRHRVKEHETLEKEFSNLELKCKQLLEENYELGCANDELGFQNKLLLAMATVTEGDYHNLCVEAGYNPREEQIRVLH